MGVNPHQEICVSESQVIRVISVIALMQSPTIQKREEFNQHFYQLPLMRALLWVVSLSLSNQDTFLFYSGFWSTSHGDGNIKGRHHFSNQGGTHLHYWIHLYTPSWIVFLFQVFTKLRITISAHAVSDDANLDQTWKLSG